MGGKSGQEMVLVKMLDFFFFVLIVIRYIPFLKFYLSLSLSFFFPVWKCTKQQLSNRPGKTIPVGKKCLGMYFTNDKAPLKYLSSLL